MVEARAVGVGVVARAAVTGKGSELVLAQESALVLAHGLAWVLLSLQLFYAWWWASDASWWSFWWFS